MATLTIHLADDVKSLAETRTAEAGYANVAEYLTWLIRGEAAGAPQVLEMDSDADLESLLLARVDRASGDEAGVEMNEQDFQQIRAKLRARLDGRPEPRP
jgi:aminoglycoside phosphotransferase